VPFVAIAALFVLTDLSAMQHATALRSQSNSLVTNMLTSVQLVLRMGRDIDQLRILTEAHIFEATTVDMALAEEQIAAVQVDYAKTAQAYAPLTTLPGEAAVWNELQHQVALIQAPLEETLALSRADRDVEARRALVALGDHFHAIDDEVALLEQINRTAADTTLARVVALQGSMMGLVQALALAGVCISLVVGAAVTRRVQQGEEEQRRYAELVQASNRDLDAFAGRLAHDLRGPLSTVGAATSRLTRDAPEQEGTTSMLRRAVERMEALIGDLLTLSRIGGTAATAVCDPAAAAAQVQEDLAPRLRDAQATLQMDVESATVRCGEGFLRQVLFNLADNAIKYRKPEVPVLVEIRGHGVKDGYELSVRDNGMGMSPEEASRAFDPFYRSPRAASEHGTGLGLSIVKRVVEASGGSVCVDSQVGRGTTVVTRLCRL
jgi:signal transduction histidine kinase